MMRLGRRAMAAGVYLSTALLATTVSVLFYVLSAFPVALGGDVIVLGWNFIFYGWIFAALTVLAGLALTDFPFADSPASPEKTLAYLGARLRYTESRVQEGPGGLRVRLGRNTVVRLRARSQDGRSVVTFRADLTPVALGLELILFIILAPFALIAIPATVVIFLTARSFALRRVARLFPAEGPLPELPKQDEVSVLLVSSLAEGHRLAAEAYEAERSSYHDSQGLVFLGAFVLWAILLIATFTSLSEADFGDRFWTSTSVSVAAAAAFGLGTGFLVYRRSRPRLHRYRGRAEALRVAWEREVSRAPYPHEGPSAFEVLAESSREVPEWLEAARRSGLSRDPATGLLFMAIVFWPLYLIPAAVSILLFGNYLLAALVGALGVGVLFVLVVFYRRLKARWEREFNEESQRWNRRFDELRSRFDRYLEDL